MNVFQIEITSNCNHKCIHCYQHWTNESRSYNMMSKEALHLIYSKVVQATNKDCAFDITGGEPFINFDTLIYAFKISNLPISVNTNFTVDTNLLEQMTVEIPSKINMLISVPSMKKDIYNKITCTNNFDKLISNLKFAKSNDDKFNICANIVVSKLNYDNVLDTINRLLLYGINQIKVTKMASIYNVNSKANDIILNDAEIVSLYDKVISLQETNHNFKFRRSATCIPTCIFPNEDKYKIFNYTCSAGTNFFSIAVNGEVKPCPNLPNDFSIGNIFADEVSDIISRGKQFAINQKSRFVKCYDCSLYKNSKCMGGCLIEPLLNSKGEELSPQMNNSLNMQKEKTNLL